MGEFCSRAGDCGIKGGFSDSEKPQGVQSLARVLQLMQEKEIAAGVTASAMSEVSTLKSTDDIFLTQMVEDPMKRGVLLDLAEQTKRVRLEI